MYVKSILERIKHGRAKMWLDWKAWKNPPGMQVKDVYNLYPGSFEYRHISPGNYKLDPEYQSFAFREDYKKPFRYSRYFQRKLTPEEDDFEIITVGKPVQPNAEQLEFLDRFSNIKDALNNNTKYFDFTEGNPLNNIKEFVRSQFTASSIKKLHPEINPTEYRRLAENRQISLSMPIGVERGTDSLDGSYVWQSIYFQTLQSIFDYDDKLKEKYDYKLPMYVGRTKKWQAVSDMYGKDEVDKVQVAIGAPLQEQLDLWEQENENKVIEFPICNENQAKFRDVPKHYERFDHDYDNIIYERQRNQALESMRNSRYWELEKNEHH